MSLPPTAFLSVGCCNLAELSLGIDRLKYNHLHNKSPMYNNNNKVPGKVLEQTWCPFEDCGSSDAFTIWETKDGSHNAWCFSCRTHSRNPYGDMAIAQTNPSGKIRRGESTLLPAVGNTLNVPQVSGSPTSRDYKVGVEDGLIHPIRSLPDRMISYSTCEHFGVRVGVSSIDGETPIYTLFPRYRDRELVGFKTKYKDNEGDKKYVSTGGSDIDLFGSHKLPSKGKRVWITEGEEDAMALFQVLKESSTIPEWIPPVLSLPDGCSSASKCINRSIDLLTDFEEIVLCFDNDQPGKQARDEVCKMLAGRVSYMTLPFKDANEMLLRGKGTDLKFAAFSSRRYQPDGIVNAKDLWERYIDKKEIPSYPYPKIMVKLNQNTYGVRAPSIVTITAGTGSGKTQFLRELMYHFWSTTDEKIAGLFLEEDVTDTMKGLIALDLNKRIQLPDIQSTEEEEKASFDRLFGDGRFDLYDYFGGMDDGNLLSKLKYYASTGHKFLFLDHLSIVVSEYAAEGGERERIDTLMTKLAKFVKEFNCVLFLVVHLRKSDISRSSFELGAKPTLDDLRGSGTLKQLSWDVIGLTRNQQHEDSYTANTTEISVLKCRLTGRTGTCDYLHFNDTTGRLFAVDKPPLWGKKKIITSEDTEF